MNNKNKKYTIVKLSLGCLFVGLLVGIGFIAYLLLTEGVTITRLLLLSMLLVSSYVGGSCHGTLHKLEDSEVWKDD